MYGSSACMCICALCEYSAFRGQTNFGTGVTVVSFHVGVRIKPKSSEAAVSALNH